jgi:hypothetical protein
MSSLGGNLPPDLHQAFDGAVRLASFADLICTVVRQPRSAPLSADGEAILADLDSRDGTLIVSAIDGIQAAWNGAQAAILAVSNELDTIRGTPPQRANYGEIVESNAHRAVLAYAWMVETKVWSAADPVRWCQCLRDPNQRMDSAVIPSQLRAIRACFGRLILPSGEAMIADARAEASQAAAARKTSAGSAWEWSLSGFRYNGRDHELSGQSRRLLQAFVQAKHMTLSHDQVDEVCSESDTKRAAAYVSELNKALSRMWGHGPDKYVRPVSGEKAYRLYPPPYERS